MNPADVLCEVLADDNRRLRRQFPDLFAAVDGMERDLWITCRGCGKPFRRNVRIASARYCSEGCRKNA